MVDLVLVNHFSLLHTLHSNNFSTFDMSANPYFTEGSSANDGIGFKISCRNLLSHFAIEFCLFMEDVLLNELLLGA